MYHRMKPRDKHKKDRITIEKHIHQAAPITLYSPSKTLKENTLNSLI